VSKTAVKAIVAALAAVALLLLPRFSDTFFITMMIRIMYYGLMTVAFTFLAGQLGLFSLMIPTAFALSSYTVAILESLHVAVFPCSALLGVAVSLAASAVFGVLVNRSKGTYFLMLTLVLGQLVWALILQWVSLTKGTNGISGIAMPAFLSSAGRTPNELFYYFVLAITSLCLACVYSLIRSPFGLRLRGIKESESRMIMLGYDVALYKWTAFMIASAVSAVSGVLFVYYTGLVNPDSIGFNAANQVMISAIFGGVGSIFGALLGTAAIKTLEIVLSGVTQRYLLFIGVIFLVVIIYAPGGIMMPLARLKAWLSSRGAAADAGKTS
jgi:branched-chain amino acid transport system permease protein